MNHINSQEEQGFLTGGGEMGARMRGFAWESTQLGAPGSWPPSLRITLNILLHARFPMILFWGPDSLCFYNDAFQAAYGLASDEQALAQPAAQAFPGIWSQVGTAVQNILDGGDASSLEDQLISAARNGQAEDAYWSFSNSPVVTVEDKVGGVLCICKETTEKVRAVEDLRLSNDRFTRLLRDATMGIAILSAEDAVVSLANDAYARLIGRRGADIIGHSMFELVPQATPTLSKIMGNILRSGKTLRLYDQPFAAENPDGSKVEGFINTVYQPYIERSGVISGVIVLCQDVTEQVQSRMKLEESEQRFRSLVEASPVRTLLLSGPDMIIELANKPLLQEWRADRSIIGKPLLEVVPEIREQPFPRLLRKVFESGQPFQGSSVPANYLVDGKPKQYFFDLSYQPMRDSAGKIYGILSTAVDVTEKVLALRAIEENERNLRSLVESAPFPIGVYTGKEMRVQFLNESIIAVWGKSGNLIGKTYAEALPELQGSGIYEQLDGVYTTGKPFHAKNQRIDLVVHGRKKTFYFNYSFTPLFDADGKVYGVMNTAADVTDLVVSKQKLEQADLALRTAVELAELATWNLDVKRGTISFSPRFMEWLGFSKQTKTLREAYFHLPTEYRRPVAREIIRALQPGSPGIYDHEHPMLNRRTGREHIIHMLAQVSRDKQGMPAMLRGMAQDVTEQRLLQRRLEQQVTERTVALAEANAQLHRSNEELTQYAYVASHDLQEPLRKIRVFTGMLGRQQELSPGSIELVRKTEDASARMTQLIKDLLEFSKLLNSEGLARPLDLNTLCNAVVADFDLSIQERNAEVRIGPLPRIVGVALQMNQLFYNLLGNALKFSEPGRTPKISITSRLLSPQELWSLLPAFHPEWKYYDIAVRDNGIGFDSKYSDQIFEVFKRLHGHNVYPGSGIGLALCRRIAANAQGYLYAESEPGKGATFHVILPDRLENSEAANAAFDKDEMAGPDDRHSEGHAHAS